MIYVVSGISESAQSALRLAEQAVEARDTLEEEIRTVHTRMPAVDMAALLNRQPYVRIDDVVGLGLAKRVTASNWLNELADANLLARQKIGRGLVFINMNLLGRIFTASASPDSEEP